MQKPFTKRNKLSWAFNENIILVNKQNTHYHGSVKVIINFC